MSTFVSARQIKAARALLGWSQQDLADNSGLGVATVRRFEAERSKKQGYLQTAIQMKTTLEGNGIVFFDGEDHYGVKIFVAEVS